MWTAKTLIRLGGCSGWSESSLGAYSFCWFCHVVAQMSLRSLDKSKQVYESDRSDDMFGHKQLLKSDHFLLKRWRSLMPWLGSTGFFCSSVPVVLFDTPGISRCESQHVVSVESSSLFHHSIYLWFICFPWWSLDRLENLHADRTTVCFEPWQKPRERFGSRKTGLSPLVFQYWPFQGGTSVVVPYCYLFLLSLFILWLSYYYVSDIF